MEKKIYIIIIILIILITQTIFSQSEETSQYYNVTIYKNNEQRTGYYDTKGVPVLHGIKWKYDVEGDYLIKDGYIYIGNKRLNIETGKIEKEYNVSPRLFYRDLLIGNQVKPSIETYLSVWDIQNGEKIWENENLDSIEDTLIHKDILYAISRIGGKMRTITILSI